MKRKIHEKKGFLHYFSTTIEVFHLLLYKAKAGNILYEKILFSAL
jgi:hypothetical protein